MKKIAIMMIALLMTVNVSMLAHAQAPVATTNSVATPDDAGSVKDVKTKKEKKHHKGHKKGHKKAADTTTK